MIFMVAAIDLGIRYVSEHLDFRSLYSVCIDEKDSENDS